MGTFYTNCKVANHVDRKKSVEIPKLLVDTGSEFTWVLADTLRKAGITREKKDYTFVMANGQQITRTIGFAILHVGDSVTIDEVVFAQPGDLELLGARSLEGLNLRVDSRAKKLVAGGPILAAARTVVRKAGEVRPLTPDELGELAKEMAEAKDPAEADRLQAEIVRGFYGGPADA